MLSQVQQNHPDLPAIARDRSSPGLFGTVIACFNANPLRGRICASYPGGSSIARPVGTARGTPGSSITVSTARRSIPASSSGPCAYAGNCASGRQLLDSDFHSNSSIIAVWHSRNASSPWRPCRPRNAPTLWRATAARPIPSAQSIEWVRTHDSQKFLESFYFQYGHASIADLGHAVLCFEGISELAATEIEDEKLWDGQAKSSRYQDFSKSGFITPPEFDDRAGRALSRSRPQAARRLSRQSTPRCANTSRSNCRAPRR